MEETSFCERKISHKCRHKPKAKLIIIANDYSDFEAIPTLSAAINDVTVIWNLFRRHYCFNKNQIFVYGKINIRGKMIAWKDRFNLLTDFNEETYFYYSGHGYDNGKLDLPSSLELKLKNSLFSKLYLIVDACYSHVWYESYKLKDSLSFIGATNCKRNIAGSTKLISNFTLELTKYLTKKKEEKENIKLLILFQDWVEERQYTFECCKKETFTEDLLT